VIFVNGQLVQSVGALRAELAQLDRENEVRLVLMRASEMVDVTLRAHDE
jgi:hypothetical protein